MGRRRKSILARIFRVLHIHIHTIAFKLARSRCQLAADKRATRSNQFEWVHNTSDRISSWKMISTNIDGCCWDERGAKLVGISASNQVDRLARARMITLLG